MYFFYTVKYLSIWLKINRLMIILPCSWKKNAYVWDY